ncbi:MAG TPA: hypothetical protein VF806_09615, partial [Anaerolineaceae bacterium]
MHTVADVTRIVQSWVDHTSCQFPDFAGAFLVGGIVNLPETAHFPAYRDVDLIIVLNRPGNVEETNLELLVEDVMVEVGFIGVERLSSPEAILADPEMAANIKATTVLADPMGIIKPLQPKVRNAFHHRKWVQAR